MNFRGVEIHKCFKKFGGVIPPQTKYHPQLVVEKFNTAYVTEILCY